METDVEELPPENRLTRKPQTELRPLIREESVVQLVNRDGRTYLRSPPWSRTHPSLAQVETRIRFGDAARKTKGLSSAAERARRIGIEVKGFRSTHKKSQPLPQWAKDLMDQGHDRERVLAAVEAWRKKERP